MRSTPIRWVFHIALMMVSVFVLPSSLVSVCVAEECPDTHCAADLNGSDSVDVNDILLLLSNWGADGPGACIAPSDTIVDINDLLGLLAGWGSCPPPPDPDNDLCIAAMDLGVISTTTLVVDSMVNATTDDDLGLCEGVAVEGPGRWYRIVGTGESCLVTTCTEGNEDVPFDLRLNAFCGSCELLNCVIATDGDDCGAAQSVRGELEFCTAEGVTYFILAHMGTVGEPGAYELQFDTTGNACAPDVFCVPSAGACCTGEGGDCIDGVDQFECATSGGVFYEGMGCGEFSCPGEQDYRLDDGVHDVNIAATTTGSTMWMHRYETPAESTRTIDTIETTIGSLTAIAGRPMHYAIYQGDGSHDPLQSQLLVTGDVVVDAASVNTDIAQVVDVADTDVTGSFYIAFWIEDVVSGELPGAVDGSTDPGVGQVFYAGNNNGPIDPSDLGSISRPPTDVNEVEEIDGVWMIRANEAE